MNVLLIALSLGLAGSLHCIGMCGPLVTALHVGTKIEWKKALIYHFGRAIGYGILGAIMGILGYSMQLVISQQRLAFIAGLLMLLAFIWPQNKRFIPTAIQRPIAQLRQRWIHYWRTGNKKIVLGLGILNAWLPCGLVYSALAGSVMASTPWQSALFMVLFGLANTPALLFSSQLIQYLQAQFGHRTQKSFQVLLLGFALLIMLRGAGLGIPFVSPQVSHTEVSCCQR